MSLRRLALVAVLVLIVAAIAWRTRHSGNAHGPRGNEPATVALATVRSGTAPVLLGAVGNVVSPHTVNVRPQVAGTLKEIYFSEGDSVAAGQKLFLIDPAPYQAALAQARAQLAVDRASLSAARAQFERMKPLAEKDYVTSQEYDDARAAAEESAARVVADEAAVQTAEINLGYTLIRSPIAGRTGSVAAKTGNLVSASDGTPLVVINEIDTVQVQFALPQTQLADVQQALTRGEVPVEVLGDDAEHPLARGRLNFIENAVDPSTGTVALKALIDNADHRLWPGTFVTVRLQLAVEDGALLVPESAVQPGAEGQYVFVVDADGKAQLRTVTIDRQVGGELVVTHGLKAGETIVAKIPHNLQPGTAVIGIGQHTDGKPGGRP
ncbi:efflux RND transporter periplasmic adaptor subunit [Solimonas variicoloris]|uniref:efflux RND transporter periplasmic adaptor subunit n=1 Tax=Solimonas variicoloris TaxID=254408 RepID=UPI0003783943|nr:efflux RND transporter periplasmic adaptor subunit [Solimonas variicoloris]